MSLRKTAVLSVLMVCGASVYAESVEIDVTADFFGKYIWRGQNLNNSTVFQPGVGVSYAGLTGAVWGNLDMTDSNGQRGEFTEWDFSLDYTAALPGVEGVDVSVGLIHYHFPSTRPSNTAEVYWGFAFDLPLAPSVTVYHDIDSFNGTYVSLGVGHSFEELFRLSPQMPVGLDIGVSAGWGNAQYNGDYWDVKNSKLNDLTVSLAFPVDVAGWTVSPSVNYVTLLNNRLRASDAYAQKSDYLFAGLSVSKSF
mgnify:CR=1 FL=1